MTFLQRFGLLLFVLFIADAIVYHALQHEYIGTTMIAMTGVGFGFIALYALTAVRKARAPGARAARQEEPHVRGTIWPAVFALSAIGFTLGVLVTPWLLVVGGALFIAAAAGWTAETRRQWKGGQTQAAREPCTIRIEGVMMEP